MERKVAVIHTTVVTCDGINSRLKALVPDAEVMNIVDDSLLNDVKKEGMLTKEVTRRLLTYALEAQDWGAELILNACSSVGEGVDVIRPLLKIPYLKIDEPMARSAVERVKNSCIRHGENHAGAKCEAHKPYCRSREKEGCGGFLFGFRCV